MITVPHKNNLLEQTAQMVAGFLPTDKNIEFVGTKDTFKVYWLQNGKTSSFTDLPTTIYDLVKDAYLQTPKAVTVLSKISKDFKRQVELFTCYMWGDLDSVPDIKDGTLSASENFRSKRDCPSLLWNKKYINIGDYILDQRELMMLDLMSDDFPDKAISAALDISHSYYDELKRKLFINTNTHSKPALLLKARTFKVI